MNDIFSIAAMFILFRETLEAAVIISVMLQICSKLKLHSLKKWGGLPNNCSTRVFLPRSTRYVMLNSGVNYLQALTQAS